MKTSCGARSITNPFDNCDAIVTVAKGGLTYLPLLARYGKPIYICWGSRLEDHRQFRWAVAPDGDEMNVVLFDRSITTGCTVKAVSEWLQTQGLIVHAVGTCDPLCRLGVVFLDTVAIKENGGLTLMRRDEYVKNYGVCGNYSFVIDPDDLPSQSIARDYELPVVELELSGKESVQDLADVANKEPSGDVALIASGREVMERTLIYTHFTGKPAVFCGSDCSAGQLDRMMAWLAVTPHGR